MAQPRKTAAEARAEVEARRREERAARAGTLDERFGTQTPGGGLIVASWVGTALLLAGCLWGIVDFDEEELTTGLIGSTVVSLGLFAAGCVAFLAAIWAGAQRSRTHVLGIGGWFFLSGSAPARVRWQLLGAVALQLVIGIVAASVRPFSPLAFATLCWVFGLGICGWWGALHGEFEERP